MGICLFKEAAGTCKGCQFLKKCNNKDKDVKFVKVSTVVKAVRDSNKAADFRRLRKIVKVEFQRVDGVVVKKQFTWRCCNQTVNLEEYSKDGMNRVIQELLEYAEPVYSIVSFEILEAHETLKAVVAREDDSTFTQEIEWDENVEHIDDALSAYQKILDKKYEVCDYYLDLEVR